MSMLGGMSEKRFRRIDGAPLAWPPFAKTPALVMVGGVGRTVSGRDADVAVVNW